MGAVVKLEVYKERMAATCGHGRVIDEVLTKDGKRSGKVRCLECRAVFDDPYRGLK